MKIFAVDSSAVAASAALAENKKIIGESYVNVGLTHSQTLMPMVYSVLSSTAVSVNDIDYFAITIGPGSFTGIRIGAAAVKGLAENNKTKCIPVSTLEAIAYPLRGTDCIACAVMDARCAQVYCAIFENGKRLCDDKAVYIKDLGEELKQYDKKIIFIGDGAELCFDALKDTLSCEKANEQIEFQRASSAALIAFERTETAVSPEKIVPVYLRVPQAERELNNKNKSK